MMGSVTAAFMQEYAMLTGELRELRNLRDDLAAWFHVERDLEDEFAAFQRARAKARRAAVPKQRSRPKR